MEDLHSKELVDPNQIPNMLKGYTDMVLITDLCKQSFAAITEPSLPHRLHTRLLIHSRVAYAFRTANKLHLHGSTYTSIALIPRLLEKHFCI